jgi:hypothetical protein
VIAVTDGRGQQCNMALKRNEHQRHECVAFDDVEGCEDGDGAMIKIFYAVAVSAIAAACFVALPTLSQQVRANPPMQVAQAEPLDARAAVAACGQKAWPYLEAGCLRGAGGTLAPQRDVRVVSADRPAISTGR